MASTRVFDLNECLDEIRTCEGMILPKDSMVRSITRETREYRRSLLQFIQHKCSTLRWNLQLGKLGNFSLPDIEEKYDLPLILNYYKAVLNLPVFGEMEESFGNKSSESAQTAPGGYSSDVYKASRGKIFFYLIPDELGLQDAINKLGEDLDSLKRPEDREWLLEFISNAMDCIAGFLTPRPDVSNPSEDSVQRSFVGGISTPVQALLSSFGLVLQASAKPVYPDDRRKGALISSDIVFYHDDIFFETFVEMKRKGLDSFEEKDNQGNPKDPRRLARPHNLGRYYSNILHSCLFQQARYYRAYKVCICVNSDYGISFFNKLAFDNERWSQRSRGCIPIETMVIGIDDSGLTVQLALTAVIWGAHNRTEAEIERDNRSLMQLGTLLDEAVTSTVSEAVIPPSSGTTSSRGGRSIFSGGASGVSSASTIDSDDPPTGNANHPLWDGNVLANRERKTLNNGEVQEDLDLVRTGDENVLGFDEQEYLNNGSGYQKPEILNAIEALNPSAVQFSNRGRIGDFQVLQKDPFHPTVVLCFETDRFKYCFPSIELQYENHQDVVMKVYDLCQLHRFYWESGKVMDFSSYQEFMEFCYHLFQQEIKCYQRIWEYNYRVQESGRIRVPVFHDYGHMELTPKGLPTFYKGFFIVVDYAGEAVERISEEQYKDGVIQLQRMGEIGVKYSDVSPANLRVKDDKLVFIDFNSCRVYDHPVSNEDGIEWLKEYSSFLV